MAEESPLKSIEFHYIKSNGFRVIHADGVWGGPTPRGYLTMAFYSERHPIPLKLTHEIKPEGTLGDPIDRDTKEGIVREVEVEVMLDLDMAKSLLPWLEEKIEALEKLRGPQEEK